MNAVQFARPMPVTNSRCCSDPKVKCERCAAEALSLVTNAGLVRNVPPGQPGNALVAEELLPEISWMDVPTEAERQEAALLVANAKAKEEEALLNRANLFYFHEPERSPAVTCEQLLPEGQWWND